MFTCAHQRRCVIIPLVIARSFDIAVSKQQHPFFASRQVIGNILIYFTYPSLQRKISTELIQLRSFFFSMCRQGRSCTTVSSKNSSKIYVTFAEFDNNITKGKRFSIRGISIGGSDTQGLIYLLSNHFLHLSAI